MNSQMTGGDQGDDLVVGEDELGPGDQLDGEGEGGGAQGEQAPGDADVGGEGHQPGDGAGVVALAALDGGATR